MPVVSLPTFEDGVLPPGEYEMTFDDLRASHLVLKRTDRSSWDHEWRVALVSNLEVLVSQLYEVGVTEVFVDGSFVEDKDHPSDIDGYFICSAEALKSGELQRELNLRDPHKIWTWSPRDRTPAQNFTKRQLPMWHRYRVELYPHVPGLLSGIRDENGAELEFPAAFRRSRTTLKPKGIIKLVRS